MDAAAVSVSEGLDWAAWGTEWVRRLVLGRAWGAGLGWWCVGD